jgi:hypothetical protein
MTLALIAGHSLELHHISGTSPLNYLAHVGVRTSSSFNEESFYGTGNVSTPVDIVDTVAAGEVVSVKNIIIHNPSIDAVTFTIRYYDGLTDYVLYRDTLASNASKEY